MNGSAAINANGSISSQDITVAGNNVTFSGVITAKHFTSNEQGTSFGNTGTLTASDVVSLTANNTITLNGAASGKAFTISTPQDVTTNAIVQTPGNFTATTRNAYINQTLNANLAIFNTTQDLVLGPTGSITTSQDIDANSGRNIVLSGATTSNKLNLSAPKGNVTLDGNAQAQSIIVDGKKAIIDGRRTQFPTRLLPCRKTSV